MYFITIARVGTENKIENSKVVGYVNEKEEAERIVRENADNIFDGGSYQYSIICKVNTGICPSIEEKDWYKYEIKDDYWIHIEKCEVPEGLEDYEPYIMG